MKHVFIVNPKSGRADARQYLVPQLCAAAQAANLTYETVCTEYAGHAVALARGYAETREAVRLYACGGDGTLNEIFWGAFGCDNVEIASIPCGSGNDFVRSFGTAEDFLCLADNLAGTAVPVDLVRANEGVSAAICSVGLDANVAYGIPRFRRIPLCGGSMAYNLSIIKCLLEPLGRRLHIEVDGDVYEDEYLIAAVCNGVAYGGGFRADPEADLSDGRMELVLVKKISRLRIAGLLAKYKAGAHIANDEVVEELRDVMVFCHAAKVSIRPVNGKPVVVNIDGECAPQAGLTAQICPAAARFVLPAKLYAATKTAAMAL